MKKIVLLALIAGALVYTYFWYVRGINLLLSEDDGYYLPPHTQFAVRIPADKRPGESLAGPVWSSGLPMPTPRTGVAAVALDGRVYTIGGVDSFARTVATVEALDTEGNFWTLLADLPRPLHHAAAVSMGGKLVVLGGFEGLTSKPLDTVFVFDPDEGEWKEGKPLPTAVGAAAAVVHEEQLHVLGGVTLSGASDIHLVYDPFEDEWSWGDGLMRPRSHHGALSTEKGIVIFGGREASVARNIDTVDRLPNGSGEWIRIESMPSKRSGFGWTVSEGKLYVFGGEESTTVIGEVAEFDPETEDWTVLEPMPTPRHGTGAAEVDGRIFVIGGGKHPGVSVTDTNEVFIPAGFLRLAPPDGTPVPIVDDEEETTEEGEPEGSPEEST